MIIVWKDITSYDNYGRDRGKVDPRTWSTDIDRYDVVVTRRHGLDGWFWECSALGHTNYRQLTATDVDAAKAEALVKLEEQLVALRLEVHDAIVKLRAR